MMYISAPRGAGKTTRLVGLVRKNNGIIICMNKVESDRLKERFKLSPNQVMTWDELCDGGARVGAGKLERPVYIDNVDLVLASCAKRSIEGISFTKYP